MISIQVHIASSLTYKSWNLLVLTSKYVKRFTHAKPDLGDDEACWSALKTSTNASRTHRKMTQLAFRRLMCAEQCPPSEDSNYPFRWDIPTASASFARMQNRCLCLLQPDIDYYLPSQVNAGDEFDMGSQQVSAVLRLRGMERDTYTSLPRSS